MVIEGMGGEGREGGKGNIANIEWQRRGWVVVVSDGYNSIK